MNTALIMAKANAIMSTIMALIIFYLVNKLQILCCYSSPEIECNLSLLSLLISQVSEWVLIGKKPIRQEIKFRTFFHSFQILPIRII